MNMTEDQMKCRRSAMQILEFKSRTEQELRQKLKAKDYSEEQIEDAVEYVKGFGYINDRRYAETYILNRQQDKSRTKIMQDLMQKGIDLSIAEEAWEEACDSERSERDILREQVQKKLASIDAPDEKQLRRVFAFFMRRGFKYEDIAAVVRETVNSSDF